jgi:hypothetical protein
MAETIIGKAVLAPFHPELNHWSPFDLCQWFRLVVSQPHCGVKPFDEPPPDKNEPAPELSRSEEARRIIEEYAADLREIIKKLRRHLN